MYHSVRENVMVGKKAHGMFQGAAGKLIKLICVGNTMKLGEKAG